MNLQPHKATQESLEAVLSTLAEDVDQVKAQHGYFRAALSHFERETGSHHQALELARPWRPDVATQGREELKQLLER